MNRFAYPITALLLLADVLCTYGQEAASATVADTPRQRIAAISAQVGNPLPSHTLTTLSLTDDPPQISEPARKYDQPIALTASRWTAGSGRLAGTASVPGPTETGRSISGTSTGQGGAGATLAPLLERAGQLTPDLSPGSSGTAGYATENVLSAAHSTQHRLGGRAGKTHEVNGTVASSDDASASDHGPQRNHATSFPVAPASEGMTIRLMATADGLQLVLQSKSGMNGSILADRSGTSRNKGEDAPGWWSWTAGRGSWAPVNVLTSSPLSHVGDPGEELMKKMNVDRQADK